MTDDRAPSSARKKEGMPLSRALSLAGLALSLFIWACGTNDPVGQDSAPVVGCTQDNDCPSASPPCKRTRCKPDGTCEVVNAVATPCDDGEACTVDDRCKDGACVAGPNFCGCDKDIDCAPLGDGDPCNGTLLCDKEAFPPRCRLDPASVVSCEASTSDPCKRAACDPKTGKCGLIDLPDATPCDDGEICTVDERCQNGTCTGGLSLCQCSPSKPCPDDGDTCNGTLYCDMSKPPWVCKLNPASVVHCSKNQDTLCKKNVCVKETGKCTMSPVADGTLCDDGDPCTNNDACKKGSCTAGSESICKCKTTKDCGAQDDGDQCNGTLYCDKLTSLCKLNPATVVTCPTVDDTSCLKNACYPKTGLCQPTPIEKLTKACDKSGCVFKLKPPQAPAGAPVPCDDGDACTKGEICKSGQCTAGSVICLCSKDSDCAEQEDGDQCNGTLFCNKQTGKCELNPATVIKCPSVGDTLCMKNLCAKKTGLCEMTPFNNNKLCDDGNPCTVGDLCSGGVCKAGTNTCACWQDKDCASKEDGDACNGTLYCDKTGPKPACVLNPASVVVCNNQPDSPCLKSICDPTSGACVEASSNAGGSCDDGNACTKKDICKAGACAGTTFSCDDANPCTIDACAQKTGCKHTPKNCSDGNTCTADLCDLKTGDCAHKTQDKDGMSCDADQNGCTLNDHCKVGVCMAGNELLCPQGILKSCEEVVCSSTGPSSHACLKIAKANGTPCEDDDPCTVGAICTGGKCSGATKQRYFIKTLQPPLEHGALTAIARRPGAGLVMGGWTWKGEADKPKAQSWWVVRTDEAGDPLWQDKVDGPLMHKEQGLRALWVSDSGAIFAGGAITSPGGDLDAMLTRWGDKAGPQWSKKLGTAGADEVALAMKVNPFGTSVLGGWRESGGQRRGWATALGANEQQLWTWQDDKGTEGALKAVLHHGVDGWLLAGHRLTAENKTRTVLTALSAQGATLWQSSPGGDGWRLRDAATLGARLALAGIVQNAKTTEPWIAGVSADSTSSLVWSHNSATKASVEALIAVEKGRIVQAGDIQPLGSKTSAWVAGLDALGNIRWSRSIEQGQSARARALAQAADGGIVIVGETLNKQGVTQGLVARLDPWGHVSCAEAGKCLGMAAGKCADTDPCTVELCDGLLGCKVAPVEKQLCDPEDGCSTMSACAQGKCPQTQHGRLFDHRWKIQTQASVSRVVPMPQMGYAFAGQLVHEGTQGGLVGRVGADGALMWWAHYTLPKALIVARAVQPTADGGLMVGYQGYYPLLRRYKADGTLLWTETNSSQSNLLKSHSLHDLAHYPDGSLALVLQVSESYKRYPRVIKINDNATVLWKSAPFPIPSLGSTEVYPVASPAKFSKTGDPIWSMRAVIHKGGELTLVGAIHPKGGANIYSQPWMGRLSPTGKQEWQVGYGDMKGGNDDLMFDGVATSDGGVLAVGVRIHTKPAGGSQGYLLRVDKTGKKLWSRFTSGPNQFTWQATTKLAGGGFVVTGNANILGTSHHYATSIDDQGLPRWSRTLPGGGSLSSVTQLASGDLLIGGTFRWPSPVAQILRTNAWGHTGCQEAGACASDKLNDCDDKDPCTADACKPATGCVHSSINGCKTP